ncbi:MAG: hypothetical protein HOJ16_00490 [Candidatus Peribacter sp.]|jgi:hypothetical protein|nr:hypothetical protein [Candidatus Peribacter sp.]
MKLSNQALGAVMMALQKSILSETDIVPILKSFDFSVSDDEELQVVNPPTFEVPEEYLSETKATSGSD